MKKICVATLTSVGLALLTSGCVPTTATGALNTLGSAATGGLVSPATGTASSGLAAGSTSAVTYKNKTYGFSFTIPAGWSKQSGNPDSDSVLFMQAPISNSCGFQFHITPMRKSFPASASVKASLKAAKEDIQINKLLSAKSRNDKGTTSKQRTIGWEVVEKGKSGGHQRIIYQLYDAKNRYYNLMGSANTEKFETCRPELRKIIDSIKFN
ncbi:MAG: PsbP-related protein [Methylococcales bacterium]|nr:PsbP-related protein [Methylococcales bacterium]